MKAIIHVRTGRIAPPRDDTAVSYYPDGAAVIVVLSNLQSGLGDTLRRDLRVEAEAASPD